MNPNQRIGCLLVCGARPNFMKIASLIEAFAASGRVDSFLVHTGQHYDDNMSRLFFDDLGLPRPDVNLEVGSGTHAEQTAQIMLRFEPVLRQRRPDWVFVVGDVNSTLACALVAAKEHVPVAHVEAGLRSFDRTMPEEINRVLTDQLSELLFVTEPAGMENLRREGIDPRKCHLVGDTMADTLLRHLPRARESDVVQRLELKPKGYALVTLHRAGNVDCRETLVEILAALSAIGRRMPVVFPAHPRTTERLRRFGLWEGASRTAGLRLIEPLGYLDFLQLMDQSAAVLTDSGGIQEETTILGVACLTLRETTERPYTVEGGSNRLVKAERGAIVAAFEEAPGRDRAAAGLSRKNQLTDGNAGRRISEALIRRHFSS